MIVICCMAKTSSYRPIPNVWMNVLFQGLTRRSCVFWFLTHWGRDKMGTTIMMIIHLNDDKIIVKYLSTLICYRQYSACFLLHTCLIHHVVCPKWPPPCQLTCIGWNPRVTSRVPRQNAHYSGVPNSQTRLTICAVTKRCWVFFYLLQ